MLKPTDLLDFLKSKDVRFYTGVPDSLLKEFCACVDQELSDDQHVIAANEGAAIGLAIGHHLSNGSTPMVYMQNSGLGNAVNPLLSLASPEVYSIPILLLVGWRGEPNVKDEPQHVHQGKITPDLLETMGIPYEIIDASQDEKTAFGAFEKMLNIASSEKKPVCILVRKGTFEKFSGNSKSEPNASLTLEREQAVQIAAQQCEDNAVIVCTTGMLSRELFEYRAMNNLGHGKDFLCVGGMGHASQIATAIAMDQPDRPVYCFDGDGASIMHMGSMAISGTRKLPNFVHVIFNNGCHESVGGQLTVGFDIHMSELAKNMGYAFSKKVQDEAALVQAISDAKSASGSSFVEVLVRPGHRADIGRPTTTPVENKQALMKTLES